MINTSPTAASAETDAAEVFVHISPNDTCKHDFQDWREFEDGRGGERVCAKCGLGAMEYTLRYSDF